MSSLIQSISKNELTEIVDSVQDEKERILLLESEKIQTEGIRLIGIQKTYKKYPWGIKSKHDFEALKGVKQETN